jgi:hypothetical protein
MPARARLVIIDFAILAPMAFPVAAFAWRRSRRGDLVALALMA